MKRSKGNVLAMDPKSIFEILNEDLLLIILKKVPFLDRSVTARTSKQWYRLLKKIERAYPTEKIEYNIEHHQYYSNVIVRIKEDNVSSGSFECMHNLNFVRDSPKEAPIVAAAGNNRIQIYNGWTGQLLHLFNPQQVVMPKPFPHADFFDTMFDSFPVLLSTTRLLMYTYGRHTPLPGFSVWPLDQPEQKKPLCYGMFETLKFFHVLKHSFNPAIGYPSSAVAVDQNGAIMIVDLSPSGIGNDYDDDSDPANVPAHDPKWNRYHNIKEPGTMPRPRRVIRVLQEGKEAITVTAGRVISGSTSCYLGIEYKVRTSAEPLKHFLEIWDMKQFSKVWETSVDCSKQGRGTSHPVWDIDVSYDKCHIISIVKEHQVMGYQIPTGKLAFCITHPELTQTSGKSSGNIFSNPRDENISEIMLMYANANLSEPLLYGAAGSKLFYWTLSTAIYDEGGVATDVLHSVNLFDTVPPSYSYCTSFQVFQANYLLVAFSTDDAFIVNIRTGEVVRQIEKKSSGWGSFFYANSENVPEGGLIIHSRSSTILVIDYSRFSFAKDALVVAKGPLEEDSYWPAIVVDNFPETQESVVKLVEMETEWKVPKANIWPFWTPPFTKKTNPHDLNFVGAMELATKLWKSRAHYPIHMWYTQSTEKRTEFSFVPNQRTEEKDQTNTLSNRVTDAPSMIKIIRNSIGDIANLRTFHFFDRYACHGGNSTLFANVREGCVESEEYDNFQSILARKMPAYLDNNEIPGIYIVSNNSRYCYMEGQNAPSLLFQLLAQITGRTQYRHSNKRDIWPLKYQKTLNDSLAVTLHSMTLYNVEVTVDLLKWLTGRNFPNLQTLRIWNSTLNEHYSQARTLIQAEPFDFSLLRELSLAGMSRDSEEIYGAFFPTTKNLVNFSINEAGMDIDDGAVDMLANVSMSLETLDFQINGEGADRGCIALSDLGLWRVAVSNHQLRSVKLKIAPNVKGSFLVPLFAHSGDTIEVVTVTSYDTYHGSPPARILENRFHEPNKRYISTLWSGFEINGVETYCAKYAFLGGTVATRIHNDENQTTMGSFKVIPVSPLPKLRELRLDLSFVDDEFLSKLVDFAPNMETLALVGDNNVTADSLATFPKWQHLNTLILSTGSFNGKDDLRIWRALATCHSLQKLSLFPPISTSTEQLFQVMNSNEFVTICQTGFKNLRKLLLVQKSSKEANQEDHEGILWTTCKTDPLEVSHEERMTVLQSSPMIYGISLIPNLESVSIDGPTNLVGELLPALHSLAELAVFNEKSGSASLKQLKLAGYAFDYIHRDQKINWKLQSIFGDTKFSILPISNWDDWLYLALAFPTI